jgi:hypothetical protein
MNHCQLSHFTTFVEYQDWLLHFFIGRIKKRRTKFLQRKKFNTSTVLSLYISSIKTHLTMTVRFAFLSQGNIEEKYKQ